jgi:hypothetical protein
MPSKKAPKKPGFAMFKSDDPTIKGDFPPIVDYDPDFDPRDYELSDDNTKKKKFTDMCHFPSDSLMVGYITNEAWSMLRDVTTIMVDEVDNFRINKKDRLFEARPMKLHLCKLQCFILFYDGKSRNMFGPFYEEDVLGIRKTHFLTYCSSPEFRLDFANRNKTMVNLANSIGVASPVDALTMTHYKELKEDKHFNSWNHGFIATAHMHHTHLVLDATMVQQTQLMLPSSRKCKRLCMLFNKSTFKPTKGSHWSVSLKLLVTRKVFIEN